MQRKVEPLFANSAILLKGNTSVTFVNNSAINAGGAVSIYSNTAFTVDENCTLNFDGNNVKILALLEQCLLFLLVLQSRKLYCKVVCMQTWYVYIIIINR